VLADNTFFNFNDQSHGNAFFLSNFRNLLLMEIGDALWLARATPRAWLQQGQKISVQNAPSYFETAADEIVSDVDRITISSTACRNQLPCAPQTQSALRSPGACSGFLASPATHRRSACPFPSSFAWCTGTRARRSSRPV
jgi:hypothetical protein